MQRKQPIPKPAARQKALPRAPAAHRTPPLDKPPLDKRKIKVEQRPSSKRGVQSARALFAAGVPRSESAEEDVPPRSLADPEGLSPAEGSRPQKPFKSLTCLGDLQNFSPASSPASPIILNQVDSSSPDAIMECEDVIPTTHVPPEAAADDTVQAPTDPDPTEYDPEDDIVIPITPGSPEAAADDTVPGPPGDIVHAPDSEDHAIVQDPAARGVSPYVPPPPK